MFTVKKGSGLSRSVVGRSAELAILQDAIDAARSGRGGTVLISGEAGIGKSRLIAEGLARAQSFGFLCLEGTCFERDAGFPFAAWIDLLQTYLSWIPAGRQARLLEEERALAALLPIPASKRNSPDSARTDPETEKRRLIDILVEFVFGKTAGQPVLVVLEDLHWSDRTSCEALVTLARRLSARPVLLVASYRGDPVRPELQDTLEAIRRGGLAVDIALRPLARHDVGALLREISGTDRTIEPDVREYITSVSEGNPFFVEELVKSLGLIAGSEGPERRTTPMAAVPSSIETLLRLRLERLGPDSQRVLTLAAVAGRRFDFALLQDLTGLDEGDLLRQVKQLVDEQIVVEESPDRFAFRHALIREAVYLQLLARERKILHRSIAASLDRLAGDSIDQYLPDRAYHHFGAGNWQAAYRFALQMGERARSLQSPEAAILHLSNAIEAGIALGAQLPPSLFRARGQAYEANGQFERARDDYQSALDTARALGERESEWQGLLDLGFLWISRDASRAFEYFQESLGLAYELEDRALIARSLNRVGNWHVYIDEAHESEALHRKALAISEELSDRAGMAEAYDLLAIAVFDQGDRLEGIRYFEKAIAHFRALQDRRGLLSALSTVSRVRCSSGMLNTLVGARPAAEKAISDAEEAVALAREIGLRSGESFALTALSDCLLAGGEYGRAIELAKQALLIAEEIGHAQCLSAANGTLGLIELDLLAGPSALRYCRKSYDQARTSGLRHVTGLAIAYYASALRLSNDAAGAKDLLDGYLRSKTVVRTSAQATCLTAYGEACLSLGEAAGALGIADTVIEWSTRNGGPGIVPRTWMLRGRALAALGRDDEAIETLHQAAEAAAQIDSPILWRIQVALGQSLQSCGRRDQARQAFDGAREIVERLAGSLNDGPASAAFRAAAFEMIPAPPKVSANAEAKQRYQGLTAREREVAGLIARGLSNKEIADALMVGERTVETHSGHIREKLGLTSRSQVAAWATGHRLSDGG